MIDRNAILSLRSELANGMSVWIVVEGDSIEVTDIIGAQDESHVIIMSSDAKIMIPLDKIAMIDVRPPEDDTLY
jgi:hypothetical protein